MASEWRFAVAKYTYDSAGFFLTNGKTVQCHGKIEFRDSKDTVAVVGLGKTEREALLDAENKSKKAARRKIREIAEQRQNDERKRGRG